MDVSAIAQVTQGQSAAAAQDSGSDSTSALFSYLLKHQFDGKQAGGSLINSQPMLDMVGNAPAYVPPPTPPAPQQTTVSSSSNSQSSSNQSGNGSNSSGASNSSQPVANVDSNGGGNSGSGAQSDNGNQGSQQNSSNSNSSGSGAQNAAGAQAPAARAASNSGEDATTEATAAVLAGTMHLVQQPAPVKNLSVDPTLQAGAKVDPTAGPAPTAAAPSAAPTATNVTPATAAAQAAAASAADDSAPEATPWSLNFLASATATNPQMAQQAAGLSKLTGGTSASVSTQTTSGTTVSAPSTSALVPDAVLAISGFLQNGGQDASTGGGTGDQPPGQQAAPGMTDATQLDPDAEMLAGDAQALLALTSSIQTVAQNLAASAAQPQAIEASTAAPAPVSTLAESALPQPTTPTTNTANASGFAAQLQETDQTEATQNNRPIALPSAVDQIKMQIEKGIAQGSSTIKVQLTPENMGRVEVKLEVQNGSVKATITADRADTLQVLKADQSGLVQSLQDAGLNADSNSLSFFLRGDQQRQFAQSNRQGRGQSGNSAGEDDPLLAGVTAASASSGVGAGNLDISV